MSTETLRREALHLIGGQAHPASDGQYFESRDPHDGSLVAEVAAGTAEDAGRALTAARRAFDEGPWPRMRPAERAAILHAVADALEAHLDELAELETRDSGKPIRETIHADIPRSALNLRFFADYVSLAGNEAYPDGNRLSYTLYPPAGVVTAISPWNAPLMLATWKIAPALAFGNTVVHKPSPQAPLTSGRLAQLALEAGLPEGVLNVVHGEGAVGQALTTDRRVDRITFTGASATGALIAASAAPNLTPLSLELGGKSANVVFADADLDQAVAGAVKAIFTANGQMCLAGSRLLVQRSILPEFLDRLQVATADLSVGDPRDRQTAIGPLIESRHREKVHGYVELAQREGANLVAGGEKLLAGEWADGCYYAPTILSEMTNQMRAAREEIFGPVVGVLAFDDEAQALAIANDSPYGLAGMVWTSNLNRAHRMAANWRAGTVWVNTFFERDLRLPFGGEGISGMGREGGQYSRDFFTKPRAVVLNLAEN
jgi:aminomuconate-semialdehyde/2-hydroxymuconate-6-semialdehyde dehydrogenase